MIAEHHGYYNIGSITYSSPVPLYGNLSYMPVKTLIQACVIEALQCSQDTCASDLC